MINYRIISKRIGDDPYGIKKAAYKQLEEKSIELIKTKMSNVESILKNYNVEIVIDFNKNPFAIVNSENLPDEIHQQVESILTSVEN